MYRLILAAAAAGIAFLAVQNANAADTYPARTRVQMDRLVDSVQPYNWTGFYVGGNVGYGWNGNAVNTSTFGNFTTDNSIGTGSRATFGLQLGINYQFAPKWVAGLETDLQKANLGGSSTNTWCDIPGCGYNGSTTTGASLDWFGTTRLRLGYLPYDTVMLYGTGGVAYGGLRGTVSDNCPFCSFSQETKQMGFGWAAGAGVEWAFAKNWSAKVEGLHIDLTSQNQTNNYGGGYVQTSHMGWRGNVARIGINYKF